MGSSTGLFYSFTCKKGISTSPIYMIPLSTCKGMEIFWQTSAGAGDLALLLSLVLSAAPFRASARQSLPWPKGRSGSEVFRTFFCCALLLGLRCPHTSTNATQLASLCPMADTCSSSALLQHIQEEREPCCWLERGNGKCLPQLLLSPPLSWSRKAQQVALFQSPGRIEGERRR